MLNRSIYLVRNHISIPWNIYHQRHLVSYLRLLFPTYQIPLSSLYFFASPSFSFKNTGLEDLYDDFLVHTLLAPDSDIKSIATLLNNYFTSSSLREQVYQHLISVSSRLCSWSERMRQECALISDLS